MGIGVFGIVYKLFSGVFTELPFWFALLFTFSLIAVLLVFKAIIFMRMGEPAIFAFVPIYNEWVLYKRTLGNGVLSLLQLVPIVGIIMRIIQRMEMAKVFGKSELVGVLLILFPVIGEAYLVLSEAEYEGMRTKSYWDEFLDIFRRR